MRRSIVPALFVVLVLASSLDACEVARKHPNTSELVGRQTSARVPIQPMHREAHQTVVRRIPTSDMLRKFPYPYLAMLAISADADHQTLRKFNLIHEFLNTKDTTPAGQGVGMDISDSFFMYNGSNLPGAIDYNNIPIQGELSYFKGTSNVPYAAPILDQYIHSGWIDTIHSYGDFSRVNQGQTQFTRALAKQAIQSWNAAGNKLTVWTNHGNQSNVDNFGSYGLRLFYNYQRGANSGSPYYHTDLLIPYGVKFVWPDVSSDVFGHNSIIYPLRIPDGRRVWGFWRYTNQRYELRGATKWLWTVDDLARQLTYSHLAWIEWQRQYAIVATHLSSNNDQWPLPSNAISALKTLKHEMDKGHILVTRTSRLLQYNVTQQYLEFHADEVNGQEIIHIDSVDDPVFGTHTPTLDELRGITFYAPNPQNTTLEIGNQPIALSLMQYNPTDGKEPSIGIKWFPADYTNYGRSTPGVD